MVTRPMPALKLYKIGVRFDVGGETDAAPARVEDRGGAGAGHGAIPSVIPVTEVDRTAIRVLQQDLPVVPRPFDVWADEAGMAVEALLEAASRFRTAGWMRRFSAVLRHRAAGFGANAMGVWVVPPEQHDAFGRTAASFAAVSHCYLRTTYPDWPYSLFTMVHGTSRNDCESVLAAVAAETGVREYSVLYSTVEYKKTRVRYFTGDVEAWEAAASLSTPVPGG
jgi:DNA-binding Lrp family transcriptional regulator